MPAPLLPRPVNLSCEGRTAHPNPLLIPFRSQDETNLKTAPAFSPSPPLEERDGERRPSVSSWMQLGIRKLNHEYTPINTNAEGLRHRSRSLVFVENGVLMVTSSQRCIH